ncbi:MAG: hypothetical protein K0R17_2266 [Rariglobus sp.]|jgi:hypothetical protein|nr:hypothetical protein [Rariglobus sp.]
MYPRDVTPTDTGCLLRLIQHGERGPATSLFAGVHIPTVGVAKPDIWSALVWTNGNAYRNDDLRCELLGRPPTIHELLLHLALHHGRWCLITKPIA